MSVPSPVPRMAHVVDEAMKAQFASEEARQAHAFQKKLAERRAKKERKQKQDSPVAINPVVDEFRPNPNPKINNVASFIRREGRQRAGMYSPCVMSLPETRRY